MNRRKCDETKKSTCNLSRARVSHHTKAFAPINVIFARAKREKATPDVIVRRPHNGNEYCGTCGYVRMYIMDEHGLLRRSRANTITEHKSADQLGIH